MTGVFSLQTRRREYWYRS